MNWHFKNVALKLKKVQFSFHNLVFSSYSPAASWVFLCEEPSRLVICSMFWSFIERVTHERLIRCHVIIGVLPMCLIVMFANILIQNYNSLMEKKNLSKHYILS